MALAFVFFVFLSLFSSTFLCYGLESRHLNNGVHTVTFTKRDHDVPELLSRTLRQRRDAGDETCKNQENTFLNTIRGKGSDFAHLFEFTNETKFTLSLTWSLQPYGEASIIVVVTHEYMFGMFAQKSTVYRSTDNGKTFNDIDSLLPGAYIRKDNGILKNPLNPKKVTLVAHPDNDNKSPLWITEDGGYTWSKYDAPFTMSDAVVFHPTQENWQLTLDANRNLYLTVDGGKNWKMIKDKIVKYKWALVDADKLIYCLHDPSMLKNMLGQMVSSSKEFTLMKSTDLGVQWLHILESVYTFGSQGKFLYASMFVDGNKDQRRMKVSTSEGAVWNEVQLPTITADRFYSILDMSEDLVFMHVDAPGDTGHGTLYTSDSSGVVFSESLDHHLYPNYEDLTDFYRVESLRGVYVASQLAQDNSIHTVISFDRGAVWQPVRRPAGAPCKDESKPCYLQIHNQYSQRKHIASKPPLSIAGAPGIIIVHGHVADALQTTPPDVYVTSDGGYNWIKALDGPHDYQIADNGGLLVAVPTSTRTPDTVKFSTDEGRCWHSYKFTNQSIVFTGLLTEPGNKAMHVGIWGFGAADHQWKIHLIDFQKVVTRQCDPTKDYEPWRAHSEMSHGMDPSQQGCLLGQKETFMRLKLDSWCQNGRSYEAKKETTPCSCHKDDYECDFGYHRPINSLDCVKRPGETEIVCIKGHEEQIKSEGYRKIPGDVCSGGFTPGADQYVNMMKACTGEKFTQTNVENDKGYNTGGSHSQQDGAVVSGGSDGINAMHVGSSDQPAAGGASHRLAIFISIPSVIFAFVIVGFLVRKYMARRRRDVTYKYSLLSQQHGEDFDNDLENALSNDTALYFDSEEELDATRLGNGTVNGKPVGAATHGMNGSLNIYQPRVNDVNGVRKTKQYHDDSDDDLLE